MTAIPEPTLSPDLLLAHEPFVRALARGLLDDEDRARDLAQDAWVAALTRPPRSGAALKGWFATVVRNTARNALRGDARRDERERAAARPERVESTVAIHERLAVQRAVVDAVLRLSEPYRSPVLLRYYEGLTPDAIAARLGRKAPTVRSQLARALELLRRDLDDLHEGDRPTWGTALAPLAGAPLRGTGLSARLVLALVGAAAALPLAWLGAVTLTRTGDPEELAPAPAATAQAPLAPTPGHPRTSGRRTLAASSVARADAGEGTSAAAPGRPDLSGLTANQLLALAVQARRRVTDVLLAPDPALRTEYAGLLERPDTGIVKLIERRRAPTQLSVEGNGAYYSFATRSHDYQHEPDIELQQGSFSSGFYGGTVGLVFDAGDVALDEVPTDRTAPAWLPDERAQAWELLWSDLQNAPGSTRDRAYELGVDRAAVTLGHTYLVRAHLSQEHDHLVAFRTVAVEDHSVTLVWRRIRTFELPRRPGVSKGREHPYWWVDPAPEWLLQLTSPELQTLLAEVSAFAQQVLLSPPEELVAEHAALTADPRAGFARLLYRGRYDPLFSRRGSGSYYSFATRSNDFDGLHDLGFQLGVFESCSYGGVGFGMVLDLGRVGLADVAPSPARPAWLPRSSDDAWAFVWSDLSNPSNEERQAVHELGLAHTPAILGHTYVVRMRHPSHDHLVAFEVLAEDSTGCTIGWRILNEWPVETQDRR